MYRVEVAGSQYTAPDLATLQQWVNEGRVLPTTVVFSEMEGQTVAAQAIQGLVFPTPQAGPYSSPAAYPRQSYEKVPNNLVLAIFSTLCCCLPFGIVSIVYASQVDGHSSRGDVMRARDSADKARTWAIASIVCGLIGGVIQGLLTFANR